MGTVIVWFRNDLRIEDNETLHCALASGSKVVCVYIFAPNDYAETRFGFTRTGPYRAAFIAECVASLRRQLQKVGSELVIRVGDCTEVLAELCQQHSATVVYCTAGLAPYEVATEDAVMAALAPMGVQLHCVQNDNLLTWEMLPFEPCHVPDVFTSFRQRVEGRGLIDAPLPAPRHIPSPQILDAGEIPCVASLCGCATRPDRRTPMVYTGGTEAAMQRLHYYFNELRGPATYFDTRNGLVGADYSTHLSAWLAQGCISPRMVAEWVCDFEAKHGASKSSGWIVFELLWREYFRLVMVKYGRDLFVTGGPRRKQIQYTRETYAFERWMHGETGNTFIDANMNELRLTGYMSNRGRQVVASYLVKDLKVNWLWGAAWFEHMLVDYDVCSNYGNWAYVAGVGNDPREDRYFNTRKQADTYDPDGLYQRMWATKQRV